MASTYVNNLRLNEMATGDASGTWGTTTNTNLELIGEALGYGTEAITTNADTHTSTVADGASDAARAMYVKYTGTLDSACTITIAPNTMKRVQIIENATSGSQSIIIKQGSGATVTIPTGRVAVVYLDGAGSGAAVVNAFTDLDLAGTLSIAGAVAAATDMTVGDDLTLSSDAGVLGFGADTDVTLTHVADTGLLLNSSRQLQFGDSGTYIHQSADGVLDLVADTEIEINATTIDMNGAVDISGNALVSGEVQTANIGYTDGDNAITIADGGGITAAAGITSTAAANTLGATSFNDANITSVGSIAAVSATFTTTDNSDNLTLTSTDADANVGPNLNLYRNSGSPADDDVTGVIVFNGRNDNSQDVIYARQLSYIKDASDGTEDGQLTLQTMVAGTIRDRLNITPAEIVLNEDSIDIDFRVESNGNANMLVVDGGSDFVSIGTSVDYDAVLNVLSTDNGKTLSLVSTDTDANSGPILALTRQSSSSAADNDYVGEIKFEGLNDANQQIVYAGMAGRIVDATDGTEDGRFELYTELAGAQISRVLADGTETVINQDSSDLDFRVESNGKTHMLFVDGGNDAVGVGCSTVGNSTLEVRSTGVDGTFANAIGFQYSGNASEANTISTSVSSNAAQSGMKFNISDGGGSAGKTNVATFLRNEIIFNDDSNDQDFRIESNDNANMLFVDGGNNVTCVGGTTVETADHFEVISSDTTTALRIRNTNAGSSAPTIIFDKASSSPADDDELGLLNYIGLDTAGNANVFAQIAVQSLDVTNGSEDGRLLIGTTNAGTFAQNIDIKNGVVTLPVNNNAYNFQAFASSSNSFFGIRDDGNDSVILQADRSDGFTGFLYNGHTLALSIGGALSKGSGSFKIDHPLEAKKDTHHLVHSFIEGPQADLIYRGRVTLSGGSAAVNVDTASDMTDGTFVVLCRDVQCFTSNETGWTAVKGVVSGNTLTITAQDNSCTDTISWMVVGERQDPHMKDSLTDWTDSDGKIIVEPAKS